MSDNPWKNLEKRLKEISELKENWDDDGAKPISKDVIDKVRNFFLCWCNTTTSRVDLQFPDISPLVSGGIDLHWKLGTCELLVTALPDSKLFEFYGDRYGVHHIKGVLVPFMDLTWLMIWILNAGDRT